MQRNLFHQWLFQSVSQSLPSATTRQNYPSRTNLGGTPKTHFICFQAQLNLDKKPNTQIIRPYQSAVICDWPNKNEDLQQMASTITESSGLQYTPTLIPFAKKEPYFSALLHQRRQSWSTYRWYPPKYKFPEQMSYIGEYHWYRKV